MSTMSNMGLSLDTPELTIDITLPNDIVTCTAYVDGSYVRGSTVEGISDIINNLVGNLPKESTSIKYISSAHTLSDVDYMGIDDEDEDIGTIVEAPTKPISEKDILMKALNRMYVTVDGVDKDTADVSVVQKRNGEYTITLKLV